MGFRNTSVTAGITSTSRKSACKPNSTDTSDRETMKKEVRQQWWGYYQKTRQLGVMFVR